MTYVIAGLWLAVIGFGTYMAVKSFLDTRDHNKRIEEERRQHIERLVAQRREREDLDRVRDRIVRTHADKARARTSTSTPAVDNTATDVMLQTMTLNAYVASANSSSYDSSYSSPSSDSSCSSSSSSSSSDSSSSSSCSSDSSF